MPLRRKAFRGAPLLTGVFLVGLPASAQSQLPTTVRVGENFRREPNGVVLAHLDPGTSLRVLGVEGDWTEVELEGWVWLRSVDESDDPSMDLVVSEVEGENLRSGPSGAILGRLEEGALLEELGRDAAWARVSRVGWIWSASLKEGVSIEASAPAGASPQRRSAGPAARVPGGVQRVGAVGGPILAAPDGDTLAVAAPDSDVEVLRRDGNWARVRLEGWMWMPAVQARSEALPADEGETETPEVLDPETLRADADAYAGRVVAWTIQFISIERAERVRTDFFEGEPFLLARFGDSGGPFVYVAVPTERLSEVEGLVPLERLSITGRVRTGSSALTGAPIVDLISLERSRERP
jgi:hypothetical protein